MTVRKITRLALNPAVCADPRQLADALNRHFAQLAAIVDQLAALANDAVVRPSDPSGASQPRALYQGAGVPPDGLGVVGDYYLRTDTPAIANQRLYVKPGPSWTGIL